MVKVLLPGLGVEIITRGTLRLQPWNYLVQIAGDLASQGYRVEVIPWPGKISSEVRRVLSEGNITIGSGPVKCEQEVLIIPLAFGYFRKWVSKHALSSRDCRLVGVLTTFLTSLPQLLRNYVRIRLTGTVISANTVLAENLLFRVTGKRLLKRFTLIISPSKDYSAFLGSASVLVYYPRIGSYSENTVGDRAGRDYRNISLLYFGPYTEERGVISIIKAYNLIRNKLNGKIRLTLLLREKPRGTKISFTDIEIIEERLPRRELFRRIASSHLVILPYRVIPSTIPLSYFEALFTGKPVVATTWIPGFREHVSQYLSEALSENYTPGELAEYILSIIDEGLSNILSRQKEYALKLQEKIRGQKIRLNGEYS